MKKSVIWMLSIGMVACADLDKSPSAWSDIEEPKPVSGEPILTVEPPYPREATPTASHPASCSGAALLEVRSDSVLRVSADGSSEMLLDFGEGAQTYVHAWESLSEAQVLVLSTHVGEELTSRVIRVTRDGLEVLTENPAHSNTVHLSEEGLSIDDVSGMSKVFIGNDVLHIDAQVSSGPADGHVLVRNHLRDWEPGTEFKWLDLSSGLERSIPTPKFHTLKQVSGGVFYQSLDGGLVISRPEGETFLSRPTQGENDIYDVGTSPNRAWLYFQAEEGSYTLINVESGELHRFELSNAGSHWQQQVVVGDQGEVSVSVAEEGAMRADYTSDFGQTWEQLGASMEGGNESFFDALVPQKIGSNAVLTNVWVGYGYYLNEIQFVRNGQVLDQIPANGFYTGGAYGISDALTFSDDGGCVAFWRFTQPGMAPFSPESQEELIIFDFATAEAIVLKSGPVLNRSSGRLKFMPR